MKARHDQGKVLRKGEGADAHGGVATEIARMITSPSQTMLCCGQIIVYVENAIILNPAVSRGWSTCCSTLGVALVLQCARHGKETPPALTRVHAECYFKPYGGGRWLEGQRGGSVVQNERSPEKCSGWHRAQESNGQVKRDGVWGTCLSLPPFSQEPATRNSIDCRAGQSLVMDQDDPQP